MTYGTQDSCLDPKGVHPDLPIINHGGVIFAGHKRDPFSLTTWEKLQHSYSYAWFLVTGVSQSRVMPPSSLAAGSMHRLTDD